MITSTKAELRTAIKTEARITTGTNLDAYIDTLVVEIMRDHCNKARYHELLVLDQPVTLVLEQGVYALPDDCQNLRSVRYGRGAAATSFRVLSLMSPVIKRTTSRGLPLYYELAGNQISLWPYFSLQVADQLLLDYYVDPATVYTADGDFFPVARLQSVVKKEATARVQRYHKAMPEAQAMAQDAQGSFTAAQSAVQ